MPNTAPLRRILGTIVGVRAGLVDDAADVKGYIDPPQMRRLKGTGWRQSWDRAVEKGRLIEEQRIVARTGRLAEKVAPDRGASLVEGAVTKTAHAVNRVEANLPTKVVAFFGGSVAAAVKGALRTIAGEIAQSPLRDDYSRAETWGYAVSVLAYEVTTGVAAGLAGTAVSSVATPLLGIPTALGAKIVFDGLRDQAVLASIDSIDSVCQRAKKPNAEPSSSV